ncbi:MAG: hypothetical protein ABIQ93_15485 [Saprospiraceae bacterium]
MATFTLPPYLRFALALVMGVILGIFTMTTIQHFFPFAPPPGVDYASGKPFNAWVGSLSNHDHVLMLMSFLVASLVGGFVTRLIAPEPAPFPLELIAGFVILFYSIVSYQAAPTPAWLTYLSCPGAMLFAWLGGWAARRMRAAF